MDNIEGSRGVSRLIYFVLILLALPSVAHAHMYAVPTTIVTVPVMALAVLILWPIKTSLTSHLLKIPYVRALWVQFLSSLLALLIFVSIQMICLIPFYADVPDAILQIIRPLAALFVMANYVDFIQWGVIVAGVLAVFALSIPALLLEKRLLRSKPPQENTFAKNTAIGKINLAFFGFLATINGTILYLMARSLTHSEG